MYQECLQAVKRLLFLYLLSSQEHSLIQINDFLLTVYVVVVVPITAVVAVALRLEANALVADAGLVSVAVLVALATLVAMAAVF